MVRVNGADVEFAADRIVSGVEAGNQQRAELLIKLRNAELEIERISSELSGYKLASKMSFRVSVASLVVASVALIRSFFT